MEVQSYRFGGKSYPVTSWGCAARKILLLFCILAMGCALWATPVSAQFLLGDRSQKAAVMVDGRMLFQVNSVEDFTARERAEAINEILEQQVQLGKPMAVETLDRNGQSTLRINGVHLLTITRQDLKRRFGVWSEAEQRDRLQQQADRWKATIDNALAQAQKERTPTYLREASLLSLAIAVGAIVLNWGLTWMRRVVLPPRPQFSTSSAQFKRQQLGRLVLTGLQFAIWSAAVYFMAGWFPFTRRGRYTLFASLTNPIFPLGEVECSIVDLFLLLGFILGLWFVVKWFTHLLKTRILSFAGIDRGVQNTVGLLAQYGLIFLGLLVLFQSWGIDLASLAIVASALGLGIGFGLQNVANNFISGLIITFDRPIKVGDFIQIGDFMGTVERIGSRSTEIVTLDQVTILVPNSRFVDGEVINWSHSNPVSRLKVPIGVAYGSNITWVRKALLEAAKSHPEVLRYPAPQVWFQEFGDSALNFEILVWIREPQKQFKIKNELNYRIDASLRRYGIEVPFPQRDLNLRSPQLEDLVSTWIRQQASPEDREAYFRKLNAIKEEEKFRSEHQRDSLDPTAFNFSEEVDIDALVKQMRGLNGVEIKDRRYGLTVYSKAFVGTEAVEWLMRTQHSGIESAIQLGQLLLERGIIHHVLDEHDFKNERLFYRFYVDEN